MVFGILVSYTCDVLTNLRVNCVAGDTSDQNIFDDDSFDAARSMCHTYTYGAIGGCFGVVGAFIGGHYGIMMKLNHNKFYIQRPVGLLVAMTGYALVYCFNNLAQALVNCHYYRQGEDKLPLPEPLPPVVDDLVEDQLQPLCRGYTHTAIGYGVGAATALLGIPIMLRFHKRGLWIVLSVFLALCALSNHSTFSGVAAAYCDMKDNYMAEHDTYSSYDMKVFRNGCKFYSHAVVVSIVATSCAALAAAISVVDTALHIDHDTLVIRSRRALLFAFAVCFCLSNAFVLHATETADCDLYHNRLGDDEVASATDDTVQRTQCEGTSAQITFYYLSLAACVGGTGASLVFNFPEKEGTIGLLGLDDGHEDEEDDKGE